MTSAIIKAEELDPNPILDIRVGGKPPTTLMSYWEPLRQEIRDMPIDGAWRQVYLRNRTEAMHAYQMVIRWQCEHPEDFGGHIKCQVSKSVLWVLKTREEDGS